MIAQKMMGRTKCIIVAIAIVATLSGLLLLRNGCGRDEAYWAERALESNDCFAVDQITNQTLLARIAVEAEDELVRRVAAEKVTDQDRLAEIKMWTEPGFITELTDQTLLAKIAVKARDPGIRLYTTQWITDQTLLAKVAVEAKDNDVRATAVAKLTDQALLAKFAAEDNDRDVRATAVRRITDQVLLAEFAVEAKEDDVRRNAVEKLTDQAMLAKIAVEDNDRDVRATAVEKLTDEALLAKVAVEAKDNDVRCAAVAKITDQALLAKIAVEDVDPAVREAAQKTFILQRKMAIVGQVQYLIDECKKTGPASPSIRGRCLVWDMNRNSQSHAQHNLPAELRASHSDAQITVFMVGQIRDVKVGVYVDDPTDGRPAPITTGTKSFAYRRDATVYVAYWPEKKAVGTYSLSADPPPKTVRMAGSSDSSAHGDIDGAIANWIKSLPKANQVEPNKMPRHIPRKAALRTTFQE